MVSRKTPLLLASAALIIVYLLYSTSSSDDDEDDRSYKKQQQQQPFVHPAPLTTLSNSNKRHHINPLVVGKNKTRLKTILYWNEFYGRYDTYDFGYGHEAFSQCRVSHCFATKDRNLVAQDKFDAVIVHIRGLPNDWPVNRSAEQRYVMLSIEAPIYLYEYRNLEKLQFNWTMTYRLDSDFPVPYAWIDQVSPLPAPLGSSLLQRFIVKFGQRAERKGPNLAEGKVGLAAQFVSNCHSSSHREVYTRELQRYIPVDVYGKCGEFECAKERGWECHRMAETKYKFFLAFEDAMCRDYATEKLFSVFGLNMVPVVLGGANYSLLAPPHSYIDVRDFESPKALAHYLKLLDKDDAKFNEYFWWRDYYKRRFRHHGALCDLCERLHRPPTEEDRRKYPDMHHWWVEEGECNKRGVSVDALLGDD